MKEQRIKKCRCYLGVRREGERNGREGGEENEGDFGIVISYLMYLIIMILFNLDL